MATGTIMLPIQGASLDATAPPGIAYILGRPKMLFDAGTQEYAYWVFRMPTNYASGPVGKLQYSMASATSGLIDFELQMYAVTDGDSQDLDADSYATANSASATVPGTAGYMDEVSITITNADSVAAGDWVAVKLSRDADDGSNDTATGDLELWNFVIEYVTT
jgi:hypothetical protein